MLGMYACFADNGMMPNSQDTHSEGRAKQPRPDDLRNIRRVPIEGSTVARTRPMVDASPDPTKGGRQGDDSQGWVLPGQDKPASSRQDWVEPDGGDGRGTRSDDESNWRQFRFGSQPRETLDHALTPPNHLKRLVAYLIDAVIILVLLSLAYPALLNRPYVDIEEIRALMELSASGAGGTEVASSSNSETGQTFSFLLLSVSASTLLNLLAYMLYHGVFLGLTGTTIGKRLMGIVVCNAEGQPVGVPRAIVRSLGVFVTTVYGAIGFIFVLFHPRRRALHDLLAGSYPVEPGRSLQQAEHD